MKPSSWARAGVFGQVILIAVTGLICVCISFRATDVGVPLVSGIVSEAQLGRAPLPESITIANQTVGIHARNAVLKGVVKHFFGDVVRIFHLEFGSGSGEQHSDKICLRGAPPPNRLELTCGGSVDEVFSGNAESWSFTSIFNKHVHGGTEARFDIGSDRYGTDPSTLVNREVLVAVSPHAERDTSVNYASDDPYSFHPFPYDGFFCLLIGIVGVFWKFWRSYSSIRDSQIILAGTAFFAYGCFRMLFWMPRF